MFLLIWIVQMITQIMIQIIIQIMIKENKLRVYRNDFYIEIQKKC